MIARITEAWAAAPTPCRKRAPISAPWLGARPHSSDASGEDDEAGEEHALAPDEVAEPAGQQQQAAEGDEEGVDDPGQVRLAEVEVVLDRGQRDVHDRDVEHDHQLRQADDDQRGPAAAVVGGAERGADASCNVMAPTCRDGRCRAKMEATSEITGGSLRNYTEAPSGLSSRIAMSTTETTTTRPCSTRPKRADARRNYDKVLAAAREAFAEGGESTSLEEIARRAGVGIGTLYRHFPNRQALLEALYVERGRGDLPLGRRGARRAPTRGRRSTAGSSASSATSPPSRRSPPSCSTTSTATRSCSRSAAPRSTRPASRCSRAPRRPASCARTSSIGEVIQMVVRDRQDPGRRSRADRAHPPHRARRPALPPRLAGVSGWSRSWSSGRAWARRASRGTSRSRRR